MKKLLILTLALTTYIFTAAQQVDSIAMRYANTISVFELETHLKYLASDELEGRETGMMGQHLAAKYIAEQFKKSAVQPGNMGMYFQDFLYEKPNKDKKGKILVAKQEYAYDTFFYTPEKLGMAINTKDVFFAGYGIEDEKYSDFAENPDIQGNVVMVYLDEPKDDDGRYFITGKKNRHPRRDGSLRRNHYRGYSDWNNNIALKIKTLEKYKPQAILFIDKSYNPKEVEELTVSSATPYFIISEELAAKIFASGKQDLEATKQSIKDSKASQGMKIFTELEIMYTPDDNQLSTQNVLGFIEGGELKDEILVISAHYDHLGKRGDKIFNGADDNATGTSALLEMAQAFALAKLQGHGPKRSVLFMLMSGEEKGLLGSAHYVKYPPHPLKNTIADLNVDMIGRYDSAHMSKDSQNYIYIIGSNMLSTDLHKINEQANTTYTHLNLDYKYNDTKDPNRYYYRSDHYNFAKNNIPVIFYFSGVHADYHKPTDTVEKIDLKLLQKRTLLVFYTAWELANNAARPKLDKPAE